MAHYKFSDILTILKSSAGEFGNNNSFRHAAALSYYTIFSLPPLLLIVITTASAVYGGEALTGQIYGQLKGLVGADAAAFLQDSIAKFTIQQKGGLATAIGVGTLIFASTTFFVTLQESINDIWNLKVKTEGIGIWQYIQQRLLSFGLILSVALLLLISFVVSAVLSIFTDWLQRNHSALCHDLPLPARCHHSLARRGHWGVHHSVAFHHRQVSDCLLYINL
jgi:membrane protein